MDAKESALLALSKVPSGAGHSTHKGTPREAFIREFLESHLPTNLALGTGEIIDCSSRPGQQRNQFDIVIYKNNYPKLDFGGGISGFLIESVVATIEVKSTLTQSDLHQAVSAAKNAKSLSPSVIQAFRSGYCPPKVLNYVVAYDGPAQMGTVYNWINPIHQDIGVTIPDLPVDAQARQNTPAPTIDGIFVLGKGFIYFDNVQMGLDSEEVRRASPGMKWTVVNSTTGNLMVLFLFLQAANSGVQGKWLNPISYVENCSYADARFLP